MDLNSLFQVEQDLERSETFISGIEDLMSGTDLQGKQAVLEEFVPSQR